MFCKWEGESCCWFGVVGLFQVLQVATHPGLVDSWELFMRSRSLGSVVGSAGGHSSWTSQFLGLFMRSRSLGSVVASG